MPIVFLPASLRPLAGGVATVEAEGATVRDVLEDLVRRQPGLDGRVIDAEGLRPEVFVAVNGEEAFGLETPVRESDEVHILPAMAGG
jgi:molybdopterin synthase sulfur carrier subunit